MARFGDMEKPEYAYDVYMKHFHNFRAYNQVDGFSCLELGPGDALLSALMNYALGGSSCYLVDAEKVASFDLAPYKRMAQYLAVRRLRTPDLSSCTTLDEVLAKCNARYLVSGLESLRTIQSASVDFIFSNAVLEHIGRDKFYGTICEMRRIIKENGVCSHTIDLRDHLTDSLNHLRFSSNLWEKFNMISNNFVNRLRYSDIVKLSKTAGFTPARIRIYRWQSLPIPKKSLAPPFRTYEDDDLRVASFDIVLKPCA
jgi:SAM-dependent methyltransferase